MPDISIGTVPDAPGAPYTSGIGATLGFWQYTDGHRPPAKAIYDNFEIRKYDAVFTRYVDVNSASPTPPYTNWLTAATNIQDAMDVALAGDEIVVTNGTYATGGRAVGTNVLVNRVAVDKPLTLRSVNGPQFTIIRGYQVPGTTNGDGAVRCVYLTNGASLSGFTLTNGATRSDGDWGREQSGGGVWCESTNALASNCVVAGNSAVEAGGGAYGGALNNCTLTGNSTHWLGGGAAYGTLNNCKLTGNSAQFGGGAGESMLDNCMLTGNSAQVGGGGAWADEAGGGAYGGTLNNCTLTGNSAGDSGGGAAGSTLNNCLVYFNTAPNGPNYIGDGYYRVVLNYCCTTPLPADGVGNISLDPQLASASHLSAGSPCRGAGSATYATGTDLDGEAWANPPSIGCDEYQPGAVTGPLSVRIVADYTNVAVGFAVTLTALIEGRTSRSTWDFGDGVALSNRPYATYAWAEPGEYALVLRAFNESHPAGARATVTIHVGAGLHYVTANNANPVPPYTSWVTAATNIQDAVGAAAVGGTVLVTNGTYTTGGRAVFGTMTNRVVVDKPLTLRSVNGPEVTIIQGYQVPGTTNGDGAIRCVYLANGASLSGFTLTHGATRDVDDYTSSESSGGGVWCESASVVVSNCVLTGNSAKYGGGAAGTLDAPCTLNNCVLSGNWASFGGGASESTLNNCTLTGNSAQYGGGAIGGTLNNCTLTGNSASRGGGVYYARLTNCTLTGNSASDFAGGVAGAMAAAELNNCIVYFNSAPEAANYGYCALNYCCTTPLPADGIGNITNAPLFVDYAGGNVRLQSVSPCINAGNSTYAPGATDLDGLPRIVSGTVDIGAYEFQGPGSVISYAWLQQYGLPTDGSVDATDADADGHNTWQEWRCQTDPTNALSVLRLLSASPAGTSVTVSWPSAAGVSYFLERSTNLWTSPTFTLLAPNLPGQPGTTTYTDTNAAPLAPLFYRVGVGH